MSFVAVDGVENLATMNRHFLWRLNAQSHFVAANFHDDNRDVIVNDDTLVLFSR